MSADYPAARDAAAAVLLEQQLYSLFIDVTKLQYRQSIHFDSLQSFCHRTRATVGQVLAHQDAQDGFTLIRHKNGNKKHLILYNEQAANPRRRSFTLAHEVGHICLGHSADCKFQEEEADCFAAGLLIPRILVWELQRSAVFPLSAATLCETFNISQQAAGMALRQVSTLSPESFSIMERAVLKRFCRLLPTHTGPIVSF